MRDFTRKRVLSFGSMLLFRINIATKSLTTELSRYFSRFYGQKDEKQGVTKQSCSEASMKMSHGAYTGLNEDLVKEYYSDDDYKKFKGYRLPVIDGSGILLPCNKEITGEYGLTGSKDNLVPMAAISAVYDVLSNISVSTYPERGDCAEKDHYRKGTLKR